MPESTYREPHEIVAALPRRTAHALHALMATARDKHVSGPLLASEVVFYDPEAPGVSSTGRALAHALRLGLCDKAGEYWWTTTKGLIIREPLETRVLAEQEEGDA